MSTEDGRSCVRSPCPGLSVGCSDPPDPDEDVLSGHKSLFIQIWPMALESGLRVTYRVYVPVDRLGLG